MSSERMEKLDRLLAQVLAQVDGCPASMARDALQFIAADFCRYTGVWQVELVEPVAAGEHQVVLTGIPKGARLGAVLAVRLGGMSLTRTEYSVGVEDIVLHEAPCRDTELAALVTLRPERTTQFLPESIMEEWGDIMAFGALAKLKTMSGANVAWTDPQGAQVNLTLYNEGIGAARTRAYRRRRGGGALFANA